MLGVLLIGGQLLAQQNRTITGRVVDSKGNGIANVTVMVKGNASGTTTTLDGTFSLTIPSGANALVVSSVGFQNTDVPITNQSNITITLSGANASLDEVVVVAYGQQQKKAITGSVSTVSADRIARQQVVSPTQALQGLATGVLVINTTGQPGENPTIRIRGIGSVNASASPLIVVDGVPFSGNINTIPPNDIESMNVLKDATATALYGSRAANGVILITTKSGSRGKEPSINVYSSYGQSSRAVNEYPYVSVEDYMKLAWETQKNYAIDNNIANPGQYATDNVITGSNGLNYNPYSVAKPIDANGNLVAGATLLWNTDWTKEVSNSDISRKNIGIGIRGGSDKFRYYMSSDYLNQDGYIINSNYKRVSATLKGDADLRSWFTVGLKTSIASTKQNYPSQAGSAFVNAVQWGRIISSIYPLYQRDQNGALKLDASGNPMYDFGADVAGQTVNQNRPVAKTTNAVGLQMLDKVLNNGLQSSINASADVKFTNFLKFKTIFGVDRYGYDVTLYNNPLYGDAASIKGRVTKEKDLTTSYTWNNMLDYQQKFGNHSIGAMVSSEAYDYKYEYFRAAKTGFPTPGLYELNPGSTLESENSYTDRTRIVSYLGRVTYNYANKYFIEGTVRKDGSSRFIADKRWGTFYAIGGSWAVSDENFMKGVNFLNLLKLRGSYGEVGNNALTSYFPYLSLFSASYPDLTNPGVYLTGLGNPSLTWEKLGTYNVGLDFALFKNRLTGSVEYYSKNTFDLLFDRPIPPSTGVTSITENIGKLKNSGIEVTLNSINYSTKSFTWETNFNFATLKNELTKLPQETIISGSFKQQVGLSLNTFFIYEWAGVNPANGLPQWYKDEVDAAGKPTGKKLIVNKLADGATRYVQGSALPKYIGGLTNSFRYKDFDLSFLFNYAFGAKILDADYIGLMNGFSTPGYQLHTDILNRWQKAGDITDVPRLKFGQNDYGNPSTRHLFSGDYIRLRNLTVGYTLPTSVVNRQNVLKSFRFYIQADNYFTWSKAKQGLDPEQNITGTSGQRSSAYKTISVGVNVGL